MPEEIAEQATSPVLLERNLFSSLERNCRTQRWPNETLVTQPCGLFDRMAQIPPKDWP
eukprot:m.261818 g.261818  ORF g.261818 m.261818 type:complete len:58 (-) comp15998_c0_seq55:1062-1235(-)